MNNINSKLIKDICDHVLDEVEEIKWADMYLGQDQTDTRPSLAYPAVLVDIEGSDFDGMGGLNQLGNCRISVRLVNENYSSSAAASPDGTREQALSTFEIEEKLVRALHGWMPDGGYAQPLTRVSDRSENRNDIGLRIRVITFTTAYEFIDE